MVGAERWAKHPADVRLIIERVARETQQFSYLAAAEMDEELVEEFQRSGMQINETDRESFLEASRRVYEQFGRDVPGGKEWIDTALALEAEIPKGTLVP